MDGTKTGQEWRGPLSEVKHPARPFGEMAELLVPPPKDVRPGRSDFAPGGEIRFCWQAADAPMAAVVFAGLAAAFGALGVALRRVEQLPAEVVLRREERGDDEGYELEIGEAGIAVRAGGERGLFHGFSTLKQWLRLERGPAPAAGVTIRGVQIADRPALRQRGVLLDVSRNRVPTGAQLEQVVEHLAELKINQLQLYFEHTFAYRGHQEVWREASPLDGAELAALDAFCRARGIELVPCQNSFGHFHRWLKHEQYRATKN